MDCPACAQKLEKAISSVEGVSNAKVLFATEKLVVDFDNRALASVIEQVSQQTGFPLTSTDAPKPKQRKRVGWALLKTMFKSYPLQVRWRLLASFLISIQR